LLLPHSLRRTLAQTDPTFDDVQVIEGMALGIGTNAEQTVILIIALASHKWIEAFAFSTRYGARLGCLSPMHALTHSQFCEGGRTGPAVDRNPAHVFPHDAAGHHGRHLHVRLPLGRQRHPGRGELGLLIAVSLRCHSRFHLVAQAIMESLAAGSFLYVSLVDIICDEFNEPGPRRKRYVLLEPFVPLVRACSELTRLIFAPTRQVSAVHVDAAGHWAHHRRTVLERNLEENKAIKKEKLYPKWHFH
jgi:hypothetical protein